MVGQFKLLIKLDNLDCGETNQTGRHRIDFEEAKDSRTEATTEYNSEALSDIMFYRAPSSSEGDPGRILKARGFSLEEVAIPRIERVDPGDVE